ncbi:MAG: hypothetical protein RSP_26270 [Rhodanobacter sp.]
MQRHSATHIHAHRLLAFVLAGACLPVAAMAQDGSGARLGTKANPGEIVLLRNVAARPANRSPISPGMALLVNPSPRGQIDNALGLGSGEMSDADFAGLSATPRASDANGTGSIDRAIHGALDSGVQGSARNDGTVAGNGVSNVVGGPMGAVGNATRGVGNRVNDALSQLPLAGLPAASGNGH